MVCVWLPGSIGPLRGTVSPRTDLKGDGMSSCSVHPCGVVGRLRHHSTLATREFCRKGQAVVRFSAECRRDGRELKIGEWLLFMQVLLAASKEANAVCNLFPHALIRSLPRFSGRPCGVGRLPYCESFQLLVSNDDLRTARFAE